MRIRNTEESVKKKRGIWLPMQGGERAGQPEQDRHGHLRQFQLQVQVSGFETHLAAWLHRMIILPTLVSNQSYHCHRQGGDHWSCVCVLIMFYWYLILLYSVRKLLRICKLICSVSLLLNVFWRSVVDLGCLSWLLIPDIGSRIAELGSRIQQQQKTNRPQWIKVFCTQNVASKFWPLRNIG